MKEFGDTPGKLSLRQFWLATAPTLAGVLLLTVIVIFWKSKSAIDLRSRACKIWREPYCGIFNMKLWPCPCWICRPCTAHSLPQHHTASGVSTALPQQTSQLSGPGPGGSIALVAVPSLVSLHRSPPGSLSQQQTPPLGAYPTSPTSTSNPNRASLPLSSAGQQSALSLLPTSRRSGAHVPEKGGGGG